MTASLPEKKDEGIIPNTTPIFIHPSQEFTDDFGCYLISKEVPDLKSKKTNVAHTHLLVISDGRVLTVTDKETLHYQSRMVLRAQPSTLFSERWKAEKIDKLNDIHEINDPYETFCKLKNVVDKYLEVKENEWYSILPLWIMGTYCFTVFEAYPYLAINGFKGSGKSKTGDLIARLAFNGVGTVGISEASLFRIVESSRATLIIDEGEQLKTRNNKADTIRQLLNAGYRRGTKVFRQEKNSKDQFETRSFDPYAPKVIVSIGGLEDVLGSRAINLIMLRAKTERGFRQVGDSSEDWDELRHKLYSFGLEHYLEAKLLYLHDDSVRVGKNRSNDLWSPLLALAKIVFKNRPDEFNAIKAFAEKQIQYTKDDTDFDEFTHATVLALEDLVPTEGWFSTKDIFSIAKSYIDPILQDSFKYAGVGYRMKRLGLNNKRHRNNGTQYFVKPEEIADIKERFGIER